MFAPEGPLTFVHNFVVVPGGFGKPSSVTDPCSCTEFTGSVIGPLLFAVTVGAVFAPLIVNVTFVLFALVCAFPLMSVHAKYIVLDPG